MARNNRSAGNGYERTIRKELIALGYPDVSTTRLGSRQMDNDGIDLFDKASLLPVLFQLKNYSKPIDVVKLLSDFDELDYNLPLIVLHKHTTKKNGRFYSIGEYFYMSETDYLDLISKITGKEINREVFIRTVNNGFHEYEHVESYSKQGVVLTRRFNKYYCDNIVMGTKELLYKILLK